MKKILALIFLVFVVAMLIPPQVKEVRFTFNTIKVEFWYPTLLSIDGTLKFSNNVLFTGLKAGADWRNDELRSTAFLCGKNQCLPTENQIAIEWRQFDERQTAIALEINRYQSSLAESRSQLAAAENYLKINSCSKMIAGPVKPTFTCTPNDEKDVATVMCAVREIGPKVCEKIANDEIGTKLPKLGRDILTRESCGAIASELMGEEYRLLERTERRYTTDLGRTIASWMIGEIFSKEAKEVFDWTIVAARFSACIPYGVEKCRASYAQWDENVTRHREYFSSEIRACQERSANIESFAIKINATLNDLQYTENIASSIQGQKITLESRVERKSFKHWLQLL